MEFSQDESKLSERERTVLLLAADGLTDKEIATNLGLSLKTIHTYWDRMRQKFNASTRTQVFAKFLRIEVAPGDKTSEFQRLFATWEEGVWIVSHDNGTIYANRRIADTFGYSEVEFQRQSVEEIFAHAEAAHLLEFVRSGNGQARNIEASIKTRDGARIWLRLSATPWSDERGRKKAVVLLVENITLRKRVEHALNSCIVALDGLIEISTDCICKFDGHLVCVKTNAAFRKVAGCEDAHVVGRNIEALDGFFEPKESWVSALRRALQTGEEQRFSAETPLGKLSAYLLPEPSADFQPLSIIAVLKCEP